MAEVDTGYHGVVVRKPLFFGESGVDPVPLEVGRHFHWPTNDIVPYRVVPVEIPMEFVDLPIYGNAFLDFNVNLKIQVTDAPALHKGFTTRWMQANLTPMFTGAFRDIAKGYTLQDFLSSQTMSAEIEEKILQTVNANLKASGVPVVVLDFNMGQGRPDETVIEQMNGRLAEIEAAKRESERADRERKRADAEEQRALADKAYLSTLGLSPKEFVALDFNKRFSEACAKGTCIIGNLGTALSVAPVAK